MGSSNTEGNVGEARDIDIYSGKRNHMEAQEPGLTTTLEELEYALIHLGDEFNFITPECNFED